MWTGDRHYAHICTCKPGTPVLILNARELKNQGSAPPGLYAITTAYTPVLQPTVIDEQLIADLTVKPAYVAQPYYNPSKGLFYSHNYYCKMVKMVPPIKKEVQVEIKVEHVDEEIWTSDKKF